MAQRPVLLGVRSRKLSNVGRWLDWWPKIFYLEFLRASEGTLSRWSRLHLQSLASTNPHWVRVECYGPISLCVVHREGLCPSSGGINRLMMLICEVSRSNIWEWFVLCLLWWRILDLINTFSLLSNIYMSIILKQLYILSRLKYISNLRFPNGAASRSRI
jgi:cellulose synthase/poly-beta-1,6-N-acetylglucosamine synthase-like glycosyltransferase